MNARFQPVDPAFEARIRASFARQKAMAFIGASLVTVEYKINLLAPALGTLVARGEVVKPGRTLTVARAEVYSEDGRHVGSMQQTLMMLADTPDTPSDPRE